MIPRFAIWLIGARWPLLGVSFGLACLAWFSSGPLPYNRSIGDMFAADDPVRMTYERFVRRFPTNEVVLAVYVDPQLLAPDGKGLRHLTAVSQRLRDVPGVRNVLSLAEINQSLAKLDVRRFLGTSNAPPLLRDDLPLAKRLLKLFEGFTHGADGTTVGIACLLSAERDAPVSRQQTIDQLRAVMRQLPDRLADGLIAGEPVLLADGFQYVKSDGEQLNWVATSLIAVAIAFSFRSLRWTLIPLLVVQLTQLLTRAVVFASGAQMTLVSSMMSAMLTVIVVAAVVHVIVRVRAYRTEGMQAGDALQRAASVLAVPIMWAAVTDAIAFTSLLASEVKPVRDYGVMMAIGALLVPLCIGLLVPGLAKLGHWDSRPRRAWGESYLDRGLAWSSWLIERGPRRVALGGLALGAIVATGTFRLQIETDFTKNFRTGSPLVQSYEFVEERLGGAGVWDVMLPAPSELTPDFVEKVQQLEARLRKVRSGSEPGLTKVLSLTDSIEMVGSLGSPEFRAAVLNRAMPAFFQTLRARDDDGQCWLRIMLRSKERQPAVRKQQIIDQVQRIVAEEFPDSRDEHAAATTGFFVLLAHLIRSTLRDQWVCFSLASVGIMLALAVAFRSVRLALIALVVNVVPVLTVLGIVGWTGQRVNLGVAMIAAVSLGISVDSSVHYLFEFRRRVAAGDSPEQALGSVQQTVGRAVVFSTLALVVGFLSLATSQFVPTVTFGLLSALAMLGSLLGSLILLPALVLLTRPATGVQAKHLEIR